MTAKFSIIDAGGNALKKAIQNMDFPIKNAATAAVTLAGINTRDKGRANIGGAGFSSKWQNTWKLKLYQVTPPQVDAAAWIYHLIPYSGIFQTGGVIRPRLRKYLWIPLRTTIQKYGRKHISPEQLVREDHIALFPILRQGKVPLLAAKLKGRVSRRVKNVSLRTLRKRAQKTSDAPTSGLTTVPLFFGVNRVAVRKRFQLDEIAQAEANKLPEYYFANLKDD